MSSKDLYFSLRKMDGVECPSDWKSAIMECKMTPRSTNNITVKLSVGNVMVNRKILNIFGAIKGFEEPGNNCLVAQSRGNPSSSVMIRTR